MTLREEFEKELKAKNKGIELLFETSSKKYIEWLEGKINNTTEKYFQIEKKQENVDKIWLDHKLGDEYQMDGKPDKWKIAYYPIFEDGKTNEKYNEPRALVEKPIVGGTDFREIPLRYLTKIKS